MNTKALYDRWIRVKTQMEQATLGCGRNIDEITLIAVSKTHPFEAIESLYGHGQLHFGENRVQELVPKMESGGRLEESEEKQGTRKLVWHMIGTLQTNKIKYMSERVDWIHSVSKLKALDEIDKRAGEAGRTVNTLIQVNISDESQKSGCEPDDLKELLLASRGFRHLKVCGLMGMASLEADLEVVRPQFKRLRELRDEYFVFNEGALQLKELSMGMSHDMEVAIQEGATMIRVGTAIFGERE
jgi:pyridoxal phosphate enzyme (YggS family)